jgi:hypothetical protein
LHPETKYGYYDENDKSLIVLPDFDWNIVGKTNYSVQIVDYGFSDLSGLRENKCILDHSKRCQIKAQTLAKTNIASFLCNWYAHLQRLVNSTSIDTLPESSYKNPEFLTPQDRRKSGAWYTQLKFATYASAMPLFAIEFIRQEIIDVDDDNNFLRQIVNLMIRAKQSWNAGATKKSKKAQDKEQSAPGMKSSWEDKARYLEKNLKHSFSNGYITRSTNIWCLDISNLVIMMTYGLLWVPSPRREFTVNLTNFVSCGGLAKLPWEPDKYFFPNPSSLWQLGKDPPTFFQGSATEPNERFIANQEIMVRC